MEEMPEMKFYIEAAEHDHIQSMRIFWESSFSCVTLKIIQSLYLKLVDTTRLTFCMVLECINMKLNQFVALIVDFAKCPFINQLPLRLWSCKHFRLSNFPEWLSGWNSYLFVLTICVRYVSLPFFISLTHDVLRKYTVMTRVPRLHPQVCRVMAMRAAPP